MKGNTMKKLIFGAMAAISLSACASHDVVRPKPNPFYQQ